MGVVVKEIRPTAPATHPCGLDAVQARSSPHGQASELAEGQKSAHVKRFRAPPPPPPTKRNGGVGRIPREKPRSLRFWRSIWRKGVRQPRAPKEGPQTEHKKTRIRISLVVFRVRSVFNPWLKIGLEFFATLPNTKGSWQSTRPSLTFGFGETCVTAGEYFATLPDARK